MRNLSLGDIPALKQNFLRKRSDALITNKLVYWAFCKSESLLVPYLR